MGRKPTKAVETRQQISVRLKRLLHEAFASGLSAADVSEAVNGALASVLTQRRKIEPYRRQAERAARLNQASDASSQRSAAESPGP